MGELVLHSRQEIRDVFRGRDDRLLVIVGPCSIHDPKAAHEYAEKLAAVKRELEDRLVIVMRVYFEKPRTTIGWKGLINDPDLDGHFNIRKGMWLARKVLTDVLSLGLPIATEWLDPSPRSTSAMRSAGAPLVRAIPKARCTASWPVACPCRSGFKNSTDGSIKAAADSCYAAAFEHHFLSINLDGRVISAETKGNPDCHVVLRGSTTARITMPNRSGRHWMPCIFPKRPARASMVWSSMPPTATAAKTKSAKPKWSKRSLRVWRTANRASGVMMKASWSAVTKSRPRSTSWCTVSPSPILVFRGNVPTAAAHAGRRRHRSPLG